MFTGLVEARGIVHATESEASGRRLTIAAPDSLNDGTCRVGDSVAINGCCLTVVAIDGARWSFQAGAETLSKTNLGELCSGDPVNLERPLPANGRLGGHLVQGHVDGVGTVEFVERDGEWTTMRFRLASDLAAQLVPKGSVAIDGVSLTVVDAESDRFSVALIPHTLQATTLGIRRPGDRVNIETDILGKYVLRALAAYRK